MRLLVATALVGCVADPAPQPAGPDPLDTVWAERIQPGDLMVLVPGTGSYDFLAATIEPLPGDDPVVDVRAIAKVADDAIVFEQAIAAAHRAGLTDAQLEGGALAFGLWGAGFTRLTHFTYVSYEGLHLPIAILGGKNSCAVGLVAVNLLGYTTDHAQADAEDLYVKTAAWLAAHPGPQRHVVIASHSWGGGISEWLVAHRDDIAARHGALPSAELAFVIGAGVPGFIPGWSFYGPGFRSVGDTAVYEVDRPDDPVHAMNPSGNGDGHQYDILIGDAYQGDFVGAYGITTEELSCRGVPGPCGSAK